MFTVENSGIDDFWFLNRMEVPEKQTLIRASIDSIDLAYAPNGRLLLNIGITPIDDHINRLNELTLDLEQLWSWQRDLDETNKTKRRGQSNEAELSIHQKLFQVRLLEPTAQPTTHIVLPNTLIRDHMQTLPSLTAVVNNATRVPLKAGGYSYSLAVELTPQ